MRVVQELAGLNPIDLRRPASALEKFRVRLVHTEWTAGKAAKFAQYASSKCPVYREI
jgi:hypothetical protein